MKKIFLLLIIMAASITTNGSSTNALEVPGSQKVKLSCSEPDAEIYVNGKLLGKGALTIKIPSKSCTTVEVKKTGYLTDKIEFCNKKDMPKPPNKYQFVLLKDQAYDVTIHSEYANTDVTVKPANGVDASWKLLNQIVLSYFDVLEMNDKETGYIRTAWDIEIFDKSAIRTRFIVKESSSTPLIYKVKLVSEHNDRHNLDDNHDMHFKEWDRILKKYEALVNEIKARVK